MTTLKLLTKRSYQPESLGVVVETTATRLTPVIWIAVDESVRRVLDATSDRAGKPKLTRRRFFNRRHDPIPVSTPTLTHEQLELIAQSVRDATQQADVSREHGDRIADGVVRRLAAMQPPAR